VLLIDNVDARRQPSRRWLRAEARTTLMADLWRRRRPVREAVELYRLSTDPAWLAHVNTDTFLTPDEYMQAYGQVFSGAEFTSMHRAGAMHWQAAEWA
jgi:hypothetical protein